MAIIDPYSNELHQDYKKIIDNFGLETFKLDLFPEPNKLMRRNLVFAGRDMNSISERIKKNKPFYVLTGIMPSSDKIHLGTKTVIEQVKYFQDRGAETYVLVADLESMMTRGISLEEAQKRALNFYIPAYFALGLDPKKTNFYFQSENKKVMHLAYKFASKVTQNEYKAIYGSNEPNRILSALTQAGDILFPQLLKKMPGIIPVGIDQDPHIRLTRDIVRRSKDMKLFLPSSIYHQFTPSLDGSMKMSKSKSSGNIELPEEQNTACKKIKRAVTGGRATLEEHRKLGAEVEKCMVFNLLKTHLIEDDDELDKIHAEYKSGKMTSGEIKEIACNKMNKFLENFNNNIQKHKNTKINFLKF